MVSRRENGRAPAHRWVGHMTGNGERGSNVTRKRGRGSPPPEPGRRPRAGASDPHIDAALDSALKETFPASDPVSISTDRD